MTVQIVTRDQAIGLEEYGSPNWVRDLNPLWMGSAARFSRVAASPWQDIGHARFTTNGMVTELRLLTGQIYRAVWKFVGMSAPSDPLVSAKRPIRVFQAAVATSQKLPFCVVRSKVSNGVVYGRAGFGDRPSQLDLRQVAAMSRFGPKPTFDASARV